MDKELKELKRTICRCCPYGPDTTKACNNRYCDMKKVMDAYKNVKKDLAGRQKKIRKLQKELDNVLISLDLVRNSNLALRAKYRKAARRLKVYRLREKEEECTKNTKS